MSPAGSLRVASTRWPTQGDYDAALEAVEVGGGGLADGLTFARDPVGTFEAYAGGAGYVYHATQRKRQYALKVFAREVPDRGERHGQIHAHLKAASSPLFVDFRFAENGVWVHPEGGKRVHSAWFPAVRMEWCSGLPLDEALEVAVDGAYASAEWVRVWLGLVAELRRTHTAHGDLQHGNVMVEENGRMRLIDYDGVFVPTMRGRLGAIEWGHPAYQHPARIRDGAPFDEHLDGVSALVILVSLACLTPELWRIRNTEGLVVGSADLQDPAGSELLEEMSRRPDPAPTLVALLRRALERPPGPCGELDEAAQLFGVELPPVGVPQPPRSLPSSTDTSRPAENELDTEGLVLPWEAELLEVDDIPEEPAVRGRREPEAADEAVGKPPRARPLGRQQVMTLASLGAGLDSSEIASLRGSTPSRIRQQEKKLADRLAGRNPKELIGFQLTRRQAEVVELRLAGGSEAECVERLGIQATTIRRHLRMALNRFHQSDVPSSADIVKRLRALQLAEEVPQPPSVAAPAPAAAAPDSEPNWAPYVLGFVIVAVLLYVLFG
jgi:hypothetical protein